MRYISPFHFLPKDIVQNNLLDTNKIKLARKKLLAEIELSSTQSIFINDIELTKFNVIALFDNLNDTKLLNIHTEIYKNKLLLNFLENGILELNIHTGFNSELLSEESINFISPYYKQTSLMLINAAIKKKDIETFKHFFAVIHLLTNGDKYKLYEYTTKKITILCNCIAELEKKIENKYEVTGKDIDNLELDIIIQILNALPDDFNMLREDIAENLNNLGCELKSNSYYNYSELFFKKVQLLNCSDYRKGLFAQNLKYTLYLKRYSFVVEFIIKALDFFINTIDFVVKIIKHTRIGRFLDRSITFILTVLLFIFVLPFVVLLLCLKGIYSLFFKPIIGNSKIIIIIKNNKIIKFINGLTK